jgi:hypothetical protein
METVKRSETSKDFLSSFSGIVLDTDGTKSWYMNGNLHREDGPAVEWGDGDKWWYIDGLYRGNNKCIFTFYQPSDYLGKDKTNVIDVDFHERYPKVKVYTLNDGFGGTYEQYIIPGMESCINSCIERLYGFYNIPLLYTGMMLNIETAPRVIGNKSIKTWCKDGDYHRTDSPAIEWSDGSKEWWVEGKYHRLDGPAVELANGLKHWYLEDQHYPKISLEDYVILGHDKGKYGIMWYKLLDEDKILEHPDIPGLITK